MITIPEDELTVKIVGDVSDIKAKLDEVSGQVKKYGSDTAGAAKEASTGMANGARETTKAVGDTGKAYEETTKTAVEHGKEVRQLIRDIKVSNIEEIQRNQLLQQTGSTFTQWGAKAQGANNMATKAISQFQERLNSATGGVIAYVGAGVQMIGMSIQTYAQISRLVLIYNMEVAQNAARTAATVANTAATQVNTTAQWGLNAALLANPAVLVGAAIAGTVIAVAAAVTAVRGYNDYQKQTQAEIQKTCDNLDRLKTKFREVLTGVGEPKDKLAEKAALEKDIAELEAKRAAAYELGLSDRAAGYEDEIRSKQEEIALLAKEIEMQGPVVGDTNVLYNVVTKMYDEAKKKYVQEHQSWGDWLWTSGAQRNKINEDAAKDGKNVIKTYIQSMYDQANSQESRDQLAIIAERLGVPLHAESPPREGPLKDIDKWGANLIRAYGEGMERASPQLSTTSERIAQSMATNIENRSISTNNYHSSPNINISGMMDLTSPNTARLIAKIVNDELRRKAVVS